MCEDEKTQAECQKPEELKGRPQDCSPEQIKKCHGQTAQHPCEPPPGPKSPCCEE